VAFVVAVLFLLAAPLGLAGLGKIMGADFELGFEGAKLVYSWPVVTGICIIVFLLGFRQPLGGLTRGVRRVKAGGVEFESGQLSLPQTTRDPRKGEIDWEEWQLEILSRLSPVDREVIVALGKTQREAFDRLFHNWWFEKVWGRIYGTQVLLLEALSQDRVHGVLDYAAAGAVFEQHIREMTQMNPDRAQWFDDESKRAVGLGQWLGFLQSAYLVQLQQEGVAKTELTGRFIAYMNEQGYTRQMRAW
jgi:hypothetical protein